MANDWIAAGSDPFAVGKVASLSSKPASKYGTVRIVTIEGRHKLAEPGTSRKLLGKTAEGAWTERAGGVSRSQAE